MALKLRSAEKGVGFGGGGGGGDDYDDGGIVEAPAVFLTMSEGEGGVERKAKNFHVGVGKVKAYLS